MSSKCLGCPLSYKRSTNPRGEDVSPDIMIVGEAPGFEEDKECRPFVGKSGRELEAYLQKAGLSEYKIYYTNVVKCHPTMVDMKGRLQNRSPTDDEMERCVPKLAEEIVMINPKVIVPMGNPALWATFTTVGGILSKRGSVGKLRMPVPAMEYLKSVGATLPDITVMPTVHPAYVLRNPGAEPKILEDLARVRAFLTGEKATTDWEYEILDTLEKVESWARTTLKEYTENKFRGMAYDIEATGLDPFRKAGSILSIQVSTDGKKGYVIPVCHPESIMKDSYHLTSLRSLLEPLFTTIPVIAHNASFDNLWMYCKFGILPSHTLFCTYFGTRFLNQELLDADLESVASRYAGMVGHKRELQEYMRVNNLGMDEMEKVPLSLVARYGAGDAVATYRSFISMEEEMKRENLLAPFNLLMMETLEELVRQRIDGQYVDFKRLKETEVEYPALMAELRLLICKIGYMLDIESPQRPEGYWKTNTEFWDKLSITSTLQLRKALFDRVGFSTDGVERKKTGLSVNQESLDAVEKGLEVVIGGVRYDELIDICDKSKLEDIMNIAMFPTTPRREMMLLMLKMIQKYRGMSWMKSSFLDNVSKFVYLKSVESGGTMDCVAGDILDSTVHTYLNAAGTVTSRMSCSDPPLHGLPHRSIAKSLMCSRWRGLGGAILVADYSQLEIRVFAMLADEKALKEAYARHEDVHNRVACMVYKKQPEDVSVAERRIIKVASFCLLYGGGAPTVAHSAGIPIDEAEHVMELYYQQLPGLKAYMKRQEEFMLKNGFVLSLHGRRRWLSSKVLSERERKARAINNPIQIIGSDMTTTAMVRYRRGMRKNKMNSKCFLSVHDSMLTDVYPGELLRAWKLKKYEMQDHPQTLWSWVTVVPEASFELGATWGDLLEFQHLGGNRFLLEGDDEAYFEEKFEKLKPLLDLSGEVVSWGPLHTGKKEGREQEKKCGIELELREPEVALEL